MKWPIVIASCMLAACCAAQEDLRGKVFPIAEAIRQSIDARLAVSNVVKSLHRYVDYEANGKVGRFIPNPDFWARGIDFSCASPWNTYDGQWRAGTAVSARHVVFAHHFPIAVGSDISFVGNDGVIVKRRLTNSVRVGDSDLMVGLLHADLPQTVKPAYVLPENYQSYIGYGNNLPVVVFDQEEKVLIREIPSVFRGQNVDQVMRKPSGELRKRFYEDFVSGDCGDPAFIVVRNGVIILATVHGITGASPSVFVLRKGIQRAMDELMPGYRLAEYDFAAHYEGKQHQDTKAVVPKR